MNKRILITMTALLLSSVGTVSILYHASKKTIRGNGFSRQFKAKMILMANDTLDVNFDSYYPAGKTKHTLYLGNIVAPRHLLIVNLPSLDTQHVTLTLNNPYRLKFRAVKIKVDSPFFYMVDGSVPAIFKGKLTDGEAILQKQKKVYFLQFTPMEGNSFAIRALDGRNEARLGLLTHNPFRLHFPPGLLVKQVDGIFCTEGMLHYDRRAEMFVYVYFYRNQYIVTDSKLRLLYKANTIDTTTQAKIKVTSISSSNSRTFTTPPLVSNRQSAMSGDRLFINSGLMADNEQQAFFEKASVFDVYDIIKGKYRLSFYVPNWKNRNLRHFEVVDDKLIVFFDHVLITYDISQFNFD